MNRTNFNITHEIANMHTQFPTGATELPPDYKSSNVPLKHIPHFGDMTRKEKIEYLKRMRVKDSVIKKLT